jgi:hypothetical protein
LIRRTRARTAKLAPRCSEAFVRVVTCLLKLSHPGPAGVLGPIGLGSVQREALTLVAGFGFEFFQKPTPIHA